MTDPLPPQSVLFVLVTETKLVTAADLFRMKHALERNVVQCAMAWEFSPPAVEVFAAKTDLPEWCIPVVFVDDETDPNALAIHYWTGFGPAARVYADKASSVTSGDEAVSTLASHEICEALVDATCEEYRPAPGREKTEIALEVCDPVQDSYEMPDDAGPVSVSNFLLPSYFQVDVGPPYDWRGTLVSPGSIGPDGYAIFRDPAGNTWLESQDGPMSLGDIKKPGIMHPWGRTLRRMTKQTQRTTRPE